VGILGFLVVFVVFLVGFGTEKSWVFLVSFIVSGLCLLYLILNILSCYQVGSLVRLC